MNVQGEKTGDNNGEGQQKKVWRIKNTVWFSKGHLAVRMHNKGACEDGCIFDVIQSPNEDE